MFSHESIPLVAIFIIMLIGVLVAFLHPVHAFLSWLRRRSERSSSRSSKEADSR
ncbi:hypothetical protein H8F23_00655 [Pseudomonas sp. P155]|uniref:LapA family protein n=1 Tax=Pseudomonas neuropathica TaxID=2730425 RepID=A0ABS0BEK6_9PSED|nr:hypothetical protein [Pseudomonas neuropathica]MBF6031752.1 hypothetical protein [Pseudomonas neuropathica]